jgi:2-aminoethylphosphonate-pyruvate transaminase
MKSLEKETKKRGIVRMKRAIIFSPGPANISERVRNALAQHDICHRDREFTNLLTDVKGLLKQILKFEDRYEVVILSGSGTLAIESLLTSLTSWKKTLLILSNGAYGERAAEISKIYKINFIEHKLDWGALPDTAKLEEEINRPEIGGIYLVHHETTTGLLNPLREISLIAKKHDKLVLVDTISSIAGEKLELGWGLDAILGTANKCFRGVPGVSFAVVSKDFLSIAEGRIQRGYYSDLITHLDKEKKGGTPFTPPIQSLFAFREALIEILEEGIDFRIAHYKEISKMLRGGLKDLGLKLYLPEKHYSNTMTSVFLPKGFTYRELHNRLKEEGFIIYNSQGKLQGKVFMLGVVGLISEQDVKNFLTQIRKTIELKK